MGKAKVLAECNIHDLDSHCDESPASVTDGCAGTACTDVIVVCHVDIENQLLHDGTKRAGLAKGLAVSRVCAVHGPNFETRGEHLYTLFA